MQHATAHDDAGQNSCNTAFKCKKHSATQKIDNQAYVCPGPVGVQNDGVHDDAGRQTAREASVVAEKQFALAGALDLPVDCGACTGCNRMNGCCHLEMT